MNMLRYVLIAMLTTGVARAQTPASQRAENDDPLARGLAFLAHQQSVAKVVFVCFGPAAAEAYQRASS